MSESTEVEQPFLAQLAAQGWDVIDQGTDIPSDPTKNPRGNFREWLLPEIFARTVARLNPGSKVRPGLPRNSSRTCRSRFFASPTAPFRRPTRPSRTCFSKLRWMDLNRREDPTGQRYREGEPRLFHSNLLLIRTCGIEADYGTITSGEEHFYP